MSRFAFASQSSNNIAFSLTLESTLPLAHTEWPSQKKDGLQTADYEWDWKVLARFIDNHFVNFNACVIEMPIQAYTQANHW